jgi:putative RecB family exonuclease
MAMQEGGRIQSPSSINTYKQCPRKYYYSYIEERPTKPSIALVRGTVVHETLELFFERRPSKIAEDVYTNLQYHILSLVKERWMDHDEEVQSLNMTVDEISFYKEETRLMLLNWLNHFWKKIKREMDAGMSFQDAFVKHTPRIETEYRSEEDRVRGYIDAIHEVDNAVHIMDYKTSKNPIISEEYKLQLAIYAFLYKKTHGKIPDKVGIFFLKHGEQLMDVNDELLKHALLTIRRNLHHCAIIVTSMIFAGSNEKLLIFDMSRFIRISSSFM